MHLKKLLLLKNMTPIKLPVLYPFLFTIFLSFFHNIGLFAQGQIVFRSDRSGAARLYIMDTDGTDLRLLEAGDANDSQADTTSLYGAAAPSWSPDGNRIVFYTYWGAEKGRTDGQDIVIINADGTNRKRLTTEGFNADPAWSPDGNKIVFKKLKDRNWGLYILDLKTGKIDLLIDTPYMDRSPDWSPDGKIICFSSNMDTKIAPTRSGEDGL